jgi:CheY-like chemotaxis protein
MILARDLKSRISSVIVLLSRDSHSTGAFLQPDYDWRREKRILMAHRRALVVDDSRSARHSLAKLLAEYDLEVAFAASGEEALAFLQHELVDVIFMDHTMPGMNGLETVSAVKANPRTATIPVMMYTAKEGEVYVSQARALGAIDVLSKQVQPGVLFEMLNKLGLVGDRRTGTAQPPSADMPMRRLADLADEVDREYEQQALGVSMQTLLVRVLEEQHLKLRGTILTNQRRFAHEVAAEIREQHASAGFAAAPPTHQRGDRRTAKFLASIAAAATVALLVMATFAWQMMTQRDAARLESARLTTASRSELDVLYQRNAGLAATLQSHQQQARTLSDATVAALEWSLSQSAPVPFHELPFGDVTARRLEELLPRLAALNFRGRVLLTAELAPFCLVPDGSGDLVLAADHLPSDACEVVGHRWHNPTSASALESVDFATALDQADAYPGIVVELEVQSPSAPELWLMALPENAGEWNALASDANRVRFGLVQETTDLVRKNL